MEAGKLLGGYATGTLSEAERQILFAAALALIACASAALELRCSSGTLQGVGGALDGIYSTKTSVQRPVSNEGGGREKFGYRFSAALPRD